jgi:hypothetical protein
MLKRSTVKRATCAGVAMMLFAGVTATPDAQQRRRGNENASQGAPVATNTIRQTPDAYYGKPVTVTAAIEAVLSKTAFVLDQRRAVSATAVNAVGQPLLVIAPTLNAPLDPKHYLMVRGQVVKFDPDAIARLAPEYTLDLPPGGEFLGQPVLLATAVIDSTYKDLAKKPEAPTVK